MKYTANLNLKKPDYSDPADIVDINANMDTLDVAVTGKASSTISIIAGNGLTGGGTLAASRTVTLGTPGTVTGATTNGVTATSHTHALTVTKTDVDLSNVGNYGVATQAEAEAGTSNVKYMTPLNTKQAIDKNAIIQDKSTTAKYKMVVIDGEPYLEVVEI